MKNKLTCCPMCNSVLVEHPQAHALDGQLFCSRKCAIQYLTAKYIQNAKEMAIEAYDSNAEVVSTEDILGEDMYEVKVTLTCTTVFKMPKSLTEQEAITTVTNLYKEGLIEVQPDECDETVFKCELVKDNNSAQQEDYRK